LHGNGWKNGEHQSCVFAASSPMEDAAGSRGRPHTGASANDYCGLTQSFGVSNIPGRIRVCCAFSRLGVIDDMMGDHSFCRAATTSRRAAVPAFHREE
jgi:hypothetical protein